ncbi:MAG: hypothetical protein FWF50_00820, partial [Defluviitaleaceae bacterium]|nr:hypothetical protein [Defluviitaleaceae bacterium]
PHCMAAINVFASNTHEQAEKMATSSKLQFLSLIRGKPGKMKPPVDNIEDHWNEREKLAVLNQLSNTLIGTKEDIKAGLEHFANITKANEIIVVCNAFHFEDRAKSYEILAEAMEI